MRGLRLSAAVAAAALSLAVVATPVAARQPGATIVDTAIAVNAATGEFDELIGAVVRAGLVDELDGHRQFTVFAPTDAAFEDLYAALGVDGVDDIPVPTLRAVLLHHVAPGERFSGDVVDLDEDPDARSGLPVPVGPRRVGLRRRCPDPPGGCRRVERRDPRHRQGARSGQLTGRTDADRPAPCEAAESSASGTCSHHRRRAISAISAARSPSASIRSTTVAMPWPTPMHIVARP